MRRLSTAAAMASLLLVGCPEKTFDLDRSPLMDPESCRDCHPDHYREWSGSMHAYAADDPVFIAMNARGQRETNGDLGDFCIQCHAPMALREGLTTDGLNVAELPQAMKGVTCFFCHTAIGTSDDHNGQVDLAEDGIMRGGLPDPVDNDAHAAEYSTLHDRVSIDSSKICGTCHDIVTPAGVELERTFKEWQGSLFAHDTPEEKQTCPSCHMQGRDGVAAEVDGVPLRRIHDHRMVGVDVALTAWPEMEDQRDRIQRELDTTVVLQLCVMRVAQGLEVTVDLENLAAGHHWPSGAAQDRRAWIELVATLGGNVVYSTGVVSSTVAVTSVQDPDLWVIRDRTFDAAGQPVHMFWEVASVQSELLPVQAELSPFDPGYIDVHVNRVYEIPIADRIEAKVNIRPIGLDVLDDLIDSGDLDASYRDEIPTFTLGASNVVWLADEGKNCVPEL